MVFVQYQKRKIFQKEHYFRVLENLDESRVATEVHWRQLERNGIYVYRVTPESPELYWRQDGHQWHHKGSHDIPWKNPKLKKMDFQLKDEKGNKVDFFRHEFLPLRKSRSGEKAKSADAQKPETWSSPYVVVFYEGSYPEWQISENPPHGNLKSTPDKAHARVVRELVDGRVPETPPKRAVSNFNTKQTARKRTGGYYRKENENPSSTSVLVTAGEDSSNASNRQNPPLPPFNRSSKEVVKDLMKRMEQGCTPTEAYRERERENFLNKSVDPAHTTRNMKQVYNANVKRKLPKIHDDIFEVYAFSKKHEGFVVKFDLLPNLILIMVNPEVNLHFNSLRTVFEPLILHYDTTFNVGKFYTSILSYRHNLFKGDPVMPLAVMFHESLDQHTHETFFRTMSRQIALNNPNTVIIKDREKSMKNAIANQIPEVKGFYCWRHMRQNVVDWSSKRCSRDEAQEFQNAFMDLLQSPSTVSFEDKLKTLKETWTENMATYFENFLAEDLLCSYRPRLEEIGIYNAVSGITNNAAESTNASFKRMVTKEKNGFFQGLSCWYFYQIDSLIKIYRGMMEKQNGLRKMDSPDSLYLPEKRSDAVDVELIEDLVVKGKFPKDLVSNQPYEGESLSDKTTMQGIAKMFLIKKRIQHIPEKGVFLVTGLQNKECMVNLCDGSCSACKTKPNCAHRLAVKMFVNYPEAKGRKKRQPSIRKVFDQYAKKNTGTKKGQKGIRLGLPLLSKSNVKKDRLAAKPIRKSPRTSIAHKQNNKTGEFSSQIESIIERSLADSQVSTFAPSSISFAYTLRNDNVAFQI